MAVLLLPAKMLLLMTRQEITDRFLMLRDEVIADGLCRNSAAFAKALEIHPQNLVKMENGDRAPTLEQIAQACLRFGYSANWLILGSGNKKMDVQTEVPLEKRVTDLEIQVRQLKKLLNG